MRHDARHKNVLETRGPVPTVDRSIYGNIFVCHFCTMDGRVMAAEWNGVLS
jgi:hypothetical protein